MKGRKATISITLPPEILLKSRELGLNISKVTENALKEYIRRLEGVKTSTNGGTAVSTRVDCPPPSRGYVSTRSLRTAKVESSNLSRPTTINWLGFKQFLVKNFRPRTAKDRFNYARKYADCLLNRNLIRLQTLTDDKRVHAMKALSSLAKYLGLYEEWKAMIKKYGLRWTSRGSDEIVIDRLLKVQNPDEVFDWIRQVKAARPCLNVFMDFIAVTGLRFNEAVNSYNLIIELSKRGMLDSYYNAEKGTLEHFRFKDLFIRKSKKAFISFLEPSLTKRVCQAVPLTYETIKSRIKRGALQLRFGDIREAHASLMTKYLRQPEIDFLHGRVSANIFMKHYFNPALINDLKARALLGERDILEKIAQPSPFFLKGNGESSYEFKREKK